MKIIHEKTQQNTTKNSRQFLWRALRYAFWSRACLTRFWLAKCRSALDQSVKQRSGAIFGNEQAGRRQ